MVAAYIQVHGSLQHWMEFYRHFKRFIRTLLNHHDSA